MPRTMAELAEWCTPSSTVLLLGAGVSVPSGAPGWDGLRDGVVADLKPSLNVPGGLPLIAEILENELGRRPLVETVRRLVDIEPIGGILSLPKFSWRSIYTTNYDRLVEKASDLAGVDYASIRSRYDLPELEHRTKLPIFKLHGCISQDRAYGDPSSMIITRGDYRQVRKWKEDLLRRMQTDMESGKILIIGQSLSDPHLDELIDEVVALQDEIGLRGRASLMLYSSPPEVQRIYEARGISVTIGDLDWFVSELLSRREVGTIGQERDIAQDSFLSETLAAITVDANSAIRVETPVRKMFAGAAASYYDISRNRTFERDAVPELLRRIHLENVAVVAGAAGLGKTTLARQVALAARSEGVQVWEHRTDLPLDVDEWAAVNLRLMQADAHGLLVLDNATTYLRLVNDLVKALGKSKEWRLSLLVTAERHRWTRLNKHPKLVARPPYTPRRLSHGELERLVRLAGISPDIRPVVPSRFFSLGHAQKLRFLKRQCASDIFICLRNIFSTTGFDTIVLEEFAELEGDLQEVYKVVAALEAVGGGSHRQLVLRMLEIDHHRISQILDDLNGLMAESEMSVVDGIYVWRTRHSEIADIITRYKYSNPDDHLALICDLVDNLRPTIDIEKNVIRALCNNPLGLDYIQDSGARLEVIESLVALLPQDHVLRHRLVREFVRSGAHGEAEQVLEQAIADVGMDPPLLRYRIELHRLRAQDSSKILDEDREALLRWAWAGCQMAMDRYSDNWYTYRSVAEVAEDWFDLTGDDEWLRIASFELSSAQGRLFEPQLDKYVAKVDELLAWNAVKAD